MKTRIQTVGTTLALCLLMFGMVTAVQADDTWARGKVLRIENEPNGNARLLIEAVGENPENLGKFIANVSKKHTKITVSQMCQPPKPAKVSDIKLGNIVTVRFPWVIETVMLQVDATSLAIMGYPYAQPSEPTPAPPLHMQVKGTITQIALAKSLLPHAGTGFLVLEGVQDDMLGYEKIFIRVTQKTKIFIPGPACGAIPAQLNQLSIGQKATVQIDGGIMESFPPQAKAARIYAGFR